MHNFTTGSLVEWKIPGSNEATGLILEFEKHALGMGAWVMWCDRDEPVWARLTSLVLSER